MNIFTHQSVDLDAVSSVWGARQFIKGARDATIHFKPANWDGTGMEAGDMALDIEAGGRGIKGEKEASGTTHSCFATVIYRYASREDTAILTPLMGYIDAQDMYGSAVRYLIPDVGRERRRILSAASLSSVLMGLAIAHHNNDAVVLDRMSEILTGMLRFGRRRQRAELEAENVEMVGGKVALMRNVSESSTTQALFGRGVRVVVFEKGHNVGMVRSMEETLRMDHDDIRAVVDSYGELHEWFAHPTGFLFCRGSRKAPAMNGSKVDPRLLAEAAAKLLASEHGAQ